MDDARIAEIRGRLAKATPGPWDTDGLWVTPPAGRSGVMVTFDVKHSDGGPLMQTSEAFVCTVFGGGTLPERDRANARLIANAPADLADLLAALDDASRQLGMFCTDSDQVRLGEEIGLRKAIAEIDALLDAQRAYMPAGSSQTLPVLRDRLERMLAGEPATTLEGRTA